MRYARYHHEDHRFVGFYDDRVSAIPSRTVPVSDEEVERLSINGERFAYDTEAGTWVERKLTYAELESVRKDAQRTVDGLAARKRSEYLTLAAGQDTIYALKYAEALAFLQAGAKEIDPAFYPFLDADYQALRESELTLTPVQIAQRIIERRNACVGASAQIEKIRRTAKERISRLGGRDPIESTVKRAAMRLKELDK